MATITRVTAGNNASIDDLNQLIDLLEGTTGYSLDFLLRSLTATDFKIRLADAAGARKLIIQDSAGVSVAEIDSDGNLQIDGSFTPSGALIIPSSAAPSQTTEASIAWDTDDDVLTVGTGAATKRLGLTRGAGSDATAANEIVYDTTNTKLKVWNGSASIDVGATLNYASATQIITTTTTYADVIGAKAATFTFPVVASGVYMAEYWVPLAFGGTGGAKFQFTGPAAPTSVDITGERVTGSTVVTGYGLWTPFAPVTAFSSDIAAFASAAVGASDTAYPNNGTNAGILIRLRLINGSNAGSVVLQAAQQNSNSTTTLGIGRTMRVERIS